MAVSVAEHLWKLAGKPLALSALPLRARKRCRDRAKRRLNTLAVARMTRVRLHERDPAGEFLHWLATVRQLAGST